MKIRPVGPELFHADRRTERQTDGRTNTRKPIVAFRSFVNATKNVLVSYIAAKTWKTRSFSANYACGDAWFCNLLTLNTSAY
jgi:hypothetical protein